MIDLEIAKELMEDFCDQVTEIIEGQHPRFVVEEWKDKVILCRTYRTNTASADEQQLVLAWATQQQMTVDSFVEDTLTKFTEMAHMRLSLSTLYAESLYAVSTAAEDEVTSVLIGVIERSSLLLTVLAQGDKVLEIQFLNMLGQLTENFTSSIKDGV